jgi:hypothetical protein
VDIKQAVAAAMEFARDSLGPARTANLRLEEIESSTVDGNAVWLITLSNPLTDDRPLAGMRSIASVSGADTAREYKVFTVAKSSGEVLSMKMRLLAAPMTR